MDYILLMLRYFTIWTLLCVILAPYIYQEIDLLLLTSTVLMVSTYLLYINPGHFRLVLNWDTDHMIYTSDVSWAGNIIHVVFHVLPWLYILFKYADYYLSRKPSSHTFFAIMLMFMYMYAVKLEEVYDVRLQDMSIINISVILVYLTLNISQHL